MVQSCVRNRLQDVYKRQEYVWPVLILKTKENYTLSLALQMYISSEGGTEFTIAMAVSVLSLIHI